MVTKNPSFLEVDTQGKTQNCSVPNATGWALLVSGQLYKYKGPKKAKILEDEPHRIHGDERYSYLKWLIFIGALV